MTTKKNFVPKEEMEKARNTNLVRLLTDMGVALKKSGGWFDVIDDRFSHVRVYQNCWKNHYTGESGRAIDFALRYLGAESVPEATLLLLSKASDYSIIPIEPKAKSIVSMTKMLSRLTKTMKENLNNKNKRTAA